MSQDPFARPDPDAPREMLPPAPPTYGAPAVYTYPAPAAPVPEPPSYPAYGAPAYPAYGAAGYGTGYGGFGAPATQPGVVLARNGQPIRLASAGSRVGGFFLSIVLAIVTLGIGYVVWTLVLWSSGRTPSKQILKQRVVAQTDGTPATWGHMAVRNLLVGFFLNGLLNSVTLYVYAIVDAGFVFSSNHQRLTDRIAQTYVAQE